MELRAGALLTFFVLQKKNRFSISRIYCAPAASYNSGRYHLVSETTLYRQITALRALYIVRRLYYPYVTLYEQYVITWVHCCFSSHSSGDNTIILVGDSECLKFGASFWIYALEPVLLRGDEFVSSRWDLAYRIFS